MPRPALGFETVQQRRERQDESREMGRCVDYLTIRCYCVYADAVLSLLLFLLSHLHA